MPQIFLNVARLYVIFKKIITKILHFALQDHEDALDAENYENREDDAPAAGAQARLQELINYFGRN